MDRIDRFLAELDAALERGVEVEEGGPEQLKQLVAYIIDWIYSPELEKESGLNEIG